MTRRDARIMARRLRRWGWRVRIHSDRYGYWLQTFDSGGAWDVVDGGLTRSTVALFARFGRPQ
jgi:hypothetical protein